MTTNKENAAPLDEPNVNPSEWSLGTSEIDSADLALVASNFSGTASEVAAPDLSDGADEPIVFGVIEAPGGHPLIEGGMQYTTLPHFEGLEMFGYGSNAASGIDLIAANHEPIFLNTIGAMALIPTGITVAVPSGFEAQIRPRSGLAAKHGISVANTPGTVDADYRGEIKIALVNLHGRRFTVERGMRIAQMVICPVVQTNLIHVNELDQTVRGEGAFGSTGV